MSLDRRLAICAFTSIAGHFAFARGLDAMPLREAKAPPRIVQVRVVQPPAPPPPAQPEPIEPPEPEEQPRVYERSEQKHPAKPDVKPVETAASERAELAPDSDATPVFGVTMQSTSRASAGPAVPVGNTTRPAGTTSDPIAPLAQAVAAVEVTKMPLPQGRCFGKYTEQARAAAIEGVVVLDLIVDEHGRARDISVVEGLSHGLTEAAIAALKACTFTPGEKDGKAVPVRVRGFKIRFVMPALR